MYYADKMQQFEKLLKKLPGQVRNEQRRRLEQLRFGQDNVMEALNFLVGARSPSATSCRSFGRSSSGSKTKNQRRKTSNGSYNGSQTPASPWASSTRTPQRGSSAPSSPSSITRSGRQSPSRRDLVTPWNSDVLARRESGQSAGSSRRPTQQSRASSEPRIQPGTVLYRSSSLGSMPSEQLPEDGRRSRSEFLSQPPQRTAPGRQLEWEQQGRSSGSSGGSSRKSGERKSPRVRVQNEESIIPPSALRERGLKKSNSVPSLSKRSLSSRGDYELGFWERLHKSWTSPESPQTARPARRDAGELFSSSAMEKLLEQDFGSSTCPSTPAAGDAITAVLHDHGRTHFKVVDHLNDAFDNDKPGLDHHGAQGDDFDGDGFDRNIGHGRRKFSVAHHNHLKGCAAIPQKKRRDSGNHGHPKEDDWGSDGLPACIGHGRAKVIDHVKDHLWEGESQASGHGHGKADMCVGGLDHSIGHGRRKVKINHRLGWPGGELDLDDLPAGLSSRDVEVTRRPKDPTHPKVTSFRELTKR